MFREKLKTYKNYEVEEKPYKIKLDANENLYPMDENLKSILLSRLSQYIDRISLYPDNNSDPLRNELSNFYNLSRNNFIIGNGSDQLIQVIMQTVCDKGDSILTLKPSFVMYKITAGILDINVEEVPFNESWQVCPEEIVQRAKEKRGVKAVFIDTPNNPTGVVFDKDKISYIADELKDTLIVVDAAYSEFSPYEYIDLVGKHQNILILKTLSKIGFAGIRCGYAVSTEYIIENLLKVKPPYNVSLFTQIIACEVIKNFDLVKKNIEKIIGERERLKVSLRALGYEVLEGYGNFVSIVVGDGRLKEYLDSKGIAVRFFKLDEGKGILRITVGKEDQNQELLEALKEWRGLCGEGKKG